MVRKVWTKGTKGRVQTDAQAIELALLEAKKKAQEVSLATLSTGEIHHAGALAFRHIPDGVAAILGKPEGCYAMYAMVGNTDLAAQPAGNTDMVWAYCLLGNRDVFLFAPELGEAPALPWLGGRVLTQALRPAEKCSFDQFGTRRYFAPRYGIAYVGYKYW